MIQISAVASSVRGFAFAAFLTASVLACRIAVAQEEPGPWLPPAGSIAGPSSVEMQEPPAATAGSYSRSAEAYPPAHGPAGEATPRLLAPVYRGPEGTFASPAPLGSTAAYPDRSPPGRPPESNNSPSAHASFPSSREASRPPAELPPPRGAAPLPRAEAFGADRDFERGFVAPSAFATDVPAEAGAATATTGERDEAKRLLPPKPGPGEALKSSTGNFPYAATFGSLAAVLGAFFIFVWFQKRGSKRGIGALPPEVVEPLGTIPFVSRQALHVVRFGSKILLVNVTIGGSETLAEIDDPREAERILALCRRNRPDSLGRTFREVLGSPRPAAGAGANDRSRGAAHA